jgi:membrane protease YdiL (CAAX protease family)
VFTTQLDRPSLTRARGLRGWIEHHPLTAFFLLAYALAWGVWIPAGLAGAEMVALIPGAFGPMVAALIVTRSTGGSLRAWARQLTRWRVPPRFYLYALGLPALLFTVVNAMLALLGYDIDPSLLPGRLPTYLATLAFVAVLGGGQEELGWRGFALPRLQARYSPLAATLLLGFLWGVWHVPLYGPLGWVLPLILAFFYTYLYNRTGSVLLCMLLHGSFTPAIEQLVLLPDEVVHASGQLGTVDAAIAAVLVAAVGLLLARTRGRLGYDAKLANKEA